MRRWLLMPCIGALLAVISVAVGLCEDGTPNLGTPWISQADSRWFVEGRAFELDGSIGDWQDNLTFSIGGRSAINESVEFGLMYSRSRSLGDERNFAILGVPPSVIETERTVLAPSLKWRCTGMSRGPAMALTLGADIALTDAMILNRTSRAWAKDDDIIPAARLQAQWGKPEAFQWQLAAQIAAWNSQRTTNLCPLRIDGFGTVTAVGGGAVWPFSNCCALTGDFMAPVEGDNYVDEETGSFDNTVVWSAGINVALNKSYNSRLTLFATNALGPSLASSIIALPNDTVGFGAALTRDF